MESKAIVMMTWTSNTQEKEDKSPRGRGGVVTRLVLPAEVPRWGAMGWW